VRHRGDLGSRNIEEIIEALTTTTAKRSLNPWPESV